MAVAGSLGTEEMNVMGWEFSLAFSGKRGGCLSEYLDGVDWKRLFTTRWQNTVVFFGGRKVMLQA